MPSATNARSITTWMYDPDTTTHTQWWFSGDVDANGKCEASIVRHNNACFAWEVSDGSRCTIDNGIECNLFAAMQAAEKAMQQWLADPLAS